MAAKKTSKKSISKSAFVRSQPATASAADIIAAGKKAGMKISSSLVYLVRGRAATKGKAKRRIAQKTSTTPKTAAGATMSKADFVRAHADLSPNEIVKKAKAAGLKFAVQYVYNVRRQEETGVKNWRSGTRTAPSRKAPAVARPIANSSRAEDLLRAVAAEVGLARAIDLLEGERARVHAVMRG
jgi:hypothetical protein